MQIPTQITTHIRKGGTNMSKRSRIFAGILLIASVGIALAAAGYLQSSGETDEVLFPDPTARTQVRLHAIELAVESFRRDHGSYPDSLRAMTADDMGRVDDLYRLDGWKRPFNYNAANGQYEIRSSGPDGVLHTSDDLVRPAPTIPVDTAGRDAATVQSP